MKTCSKCGVPKEETEFYRQADKKDGLSSWCKPCCISKEKIRYQKDPEKFCAYRRNKYRVLTPEQKKEENDKARPRKKRYYARDKLIPEALEKRVSSSKNSRLKVKFGLTPESWSLLLAKQGGVCDVCKTVPTGKKGFVVDHDHRSKKVRGLLCAQCNVAIGMLKESVTTAQSLIEYLKRHSL